MGSATTASSADAPFAASRLPGAVRGSAPLLCSQTGTYLTVSHSAGQPFWGYP